MDQPAISALQPAETKRYSTEVAKTADRSSTGVAAPESAASFPEIIDAITQSPNNAQPEISKPSPHQEHPFKLWEKDDFSFGDVVDVINPLQHLPVVATIYRKMTNDRIGFAPRVIGGALWGRIGGFVSGLINAASEWLTGKDIGDHIYTALFGPTGDSETQRTVAASKPAVQAQPGPLAFIEQAQSSFPAFNDDGGFSPGPEALREIVSAQTSPIGHVAASAVSSYNHNSELIEADEPFRVRFPA
ncbi:MAG TPA: hypothetical protein VIB79_07235 [Candidatus Binatia bacterium]